MTPTFDVWLDATLPPRLAEVVRLYFRTDSDSPALDKHRASLRDLARRFEVSRERARQLVARALALLAEPAALNAARPLFDAASHLLSAHHGVLEPADLAADPACRLPEFGTSSPLAVFLVLSSLRPDAPPYLAGGYFTSHPADLLQRASQAFAALLETLRHLATPLRPLATLAARLPDDLPLSGEDRTALFAALAAHTPGVILTRKSQCGPAPEAAAALLRALLARHPDSTLPFLTERYNALVVPSSQIGSGRIRALLMADPAVHVPFASHFALVSYSR